MRTPCSQPSVSPSAAVTMRGRARRAQPSAGNGAAPRQLARRFRARLAGRGPVYRPGELRARPAARSATLDARASLPGVGPDLAAAHTLGDEMPAEDNSIRPFHVEFPEADLAELRRRVNATRWPERETVTDDSQGVRL